MLIDAGVFAVNKFACIRSLSLDKSQIPAILETYSEITVRNQTALSVLDDCDKIIASLRGMTMSDEENPSKIGRSTIDKIEYLSIFDESKFELILICESKIFPQLWLG